MSSKPNQPTPEAGALFRENRPPRREFPLAAIVVAGAVILALFAAILFATRGRGHAGAANQPRPLDPYAGSLPLSDLVMSESTSLSGGKSTFLDGHIRNTGSQTVIAAVVQVFFRSDEGMPPAIETLPITLVRTREPYVDTELISAEPLKPGDEHDFRLIFETLPPNWNTQLPEIRAVQIATR